MDKVTLIRFLSNTKQTLGTWTAQFLNELFVCKTLELPWLNNASNISCIPEGIYDCVWTRSNRLSKESLQRWLKKNPGLTEQDCPDEIKNIYTYEILNVPGRAGIRIHSANFFFQLLGCIALGSALKDINADQELDVIHSGNTLDKFITLMGKKSFKLEIKNNFAIAA